MTFKELLSSFSDQQIISKILELYPEESKNRDGYEQSIEEMRTLTPVETDCKISVSNAKDILEGDYIDVSGIDPKQILGVSLSLSDWRECLSMEITENSFVVCSPLEILAHCLYEFTFYGYSNSQIAEMVSILNDTAAETMRRTLAS